MLKKPTFQQDELLKVDTGWIKQVHDGMYGSRWASNQSKIREPEYSQMGQEDQGNHARLFVQGDQQYHADQQYLEVQVYQKVPARKEGGILVR